MNPSILRDEARRCCRLADGLSWNDSARQVLLNEADDFERKASDLEKLIAQKQSIEPSNAAYVKCGIRRSVLIAASTAPSSF